MNQHSLYIGSTHAVMKASDATEVNLVADNMGNITVSAGAILIFKNHVGSDNLTIHEIVFRTASDPVYIQFNDNERYTYIIPAASQQGISGMPITRIKVLHDCTFAYDALA